ncbi:unnamed protein product [Amoebophrya sp. A120]|nr:unnamed protein product [Amoebophrya sp. A120]|eukprot:GSA120T00001542001.1
MSNPLRGMSSRGPNLSGALDFYVAIGEVFGADPDKAKACCDNFLKACHEVGPEESRFLAAFGEENEKLKTAALKFYKGIAHIANWVMGRDGHAAAVEVVDDLFAVFMKAADDADDKEAFVRAFNIGIEELEAILM